MLVGFVEYSCCLMNISLLVFTDLFFYVSLMIQKEERGKTVESQESSSEFEENDDADDGEDGLENTCSGDSSSSGDGQDDGDEESFDR